MSQHIPSHTVAELQELKKLEVVEAYEVEAACFVEMGTALSELDGQDAEIALASMEKQQVSTNVGDERELTPSRSGSWRLRTC